LAPTPGVKAVGPLALEECDPLGYVRCEHQAAVLRLPIAGTGVTLAYSSEWALGRLDRPEPWNSGGLGLGGWSLDVLQRYDAANEVLLSGDGTWRLAEPTAIGDGGYVVPSFDGRYAFVFDTNNRQQRTVDAFLGVDLITFTYDNEGRLSAAKGSLDDAPIDLTVERSTDGQPTGLIGAGGAATRLVVDGAGHVAAITDPSGGTTLPVTDANGLVTLHIDPTGAVTRFAYDDVGRLASWTDADGVVMSYQRTTTNDSVEILLSSPLADRWTFRSRDGSGAIERTFVAPDGTQVALSAAVDGQRTVSLPDGTRLSLGAQPDARWGTAAPVLTPIVEQRPDGGVRRAEIRQLVEWVDGDPLRPTAWSRTTVVDRATYVERFDAAARSVALTYPGGRVTSQTYDRVGRLVAYSVPGFPAVALTYDERGRLATETRGSGASAGTTSYAYDDATGSVSITRPDGVTEKLAVDTAGRIVQDAAGDGSTELVSRDSMGRAVLVRPGGQPATTLGYSAAGRATAYVPPVVPGDASYEMSAYDRAGRLVSIAGPGDRSLSFAYDQTARIASWVFDRGQVGVQYDVATGLPERLSAPNGATTSFAYVGDTLTGLAWSGPIAGSVTVTLDGQRRVVSEAVNDAPPMVLAYDADGSLTRLGSLAIERDPASGVQLSASLGLARTTWAYDADGRVTAQTTLVDGLVALDLSYEYDLLGRLAAIIETDADGAAQRTEYGYDMAGRLASVVVDGALIERNSYDGAGRRVASVTPQGRVEAKYDARGRLERWADVTYEYTPDGALVRRVEGAAITAYDFDDLGSLRGVTLPDGRQIEYVVDGGGLRVGRVLDGDIVAGFLYLPDGSVAAELDGAGRVIARFAYDDRRRLVSVERDGRTWAVISDHLGSPRLVVDPVSGEIAQATSYGAWGQVSATSGPGFLPFGYAGGLSDPDTGLVHFGARDFDPQVGRWTEPDPIRFAGGDADLYDYVGGNPVNRTDPSGLGPDLGELPAECYAAPFPCSGPHDPPPPVPNQPDLGDMPAECYSPPFACSGQHATPPPGPGAAANPPAPTPPGSSTSWGCAGILVSCQGPDSSCGLAFYCHRGPTNFTCLGLVCHPPGGGMCVGLCSIGDPHIRTADRVPLSFQGAGEYLMISSADGAVVVQARQEPPGSTTIVTITTAVAMSVAGDRVGVYLEDDGVVSLHVSGQVVEGEEVSLALANGGTVVRHGTLLLVEWPDGSRTTISQHGNHLDYGFVPDPATAPTLIGLMGTPDGDVENDLVSRDAALVLDPDASDFFSQLHGPYGDSWRITQDESLFDYGPGESTATFTLSGIPSTPAATDVIEPAARAAAEALCRAVGVRSEPTLSDCIVDVGLTGDPSYAASAAAVEAATAVARRAAGTAAVPIAIGTTIGGATSSPGEIDRYSFSASAGQVVYLDALGACSADLGWRLSRPDGTPLQQALVCQDIGRQELADAGRYTVDVFAPAGSTTIGPYAFAILPAAASVTDTIAFGEPVEGEVARIGDQPRYTFNATAGQIVYLDARGPCLDTVMWRLLDPLGAPVALAPICVDIGRHTLLASGTYAIEVYSTEAATGPFSLVAFAVPSPRESVIAQGDTVSGEIARVGEQHRYTFQVSAGQVITLDALGECVDGLVWRVIGPAGDGWAFGDACVDLGPMTLTTAGAYTVEVYSEQTATGGYRFRLG
jgi:RHS repeat-associated protein